MERIGSQIAYVKGLSLVAAAVAETLGVFGESPIFTSPFVREEMPCRLCSISYKPQVYQTGYSTAADHFHQERGGIYYYQTTVETLPDARVRLDVPASDWIAFVEPEGVQLSQGRQRRAQSIRVNEIRAFCSACIGALAPLHAGLVISSRANPAMLIPLCHNHERASVTPYCDFAVTDRGEIFFSLRGTGE